MARVTFDSVFQRQDSGFTPRQRVRVGGVEIGTGVVFRAGVSFGGVDFSQIEGKDLDVETDGDVFIIKGVYQNGVG